MVIEGTQVLLAQWVQEENQALQELWGHLARRDPMDSPFLENLVALDQRETVETQACLVCQALQDSVVLWAQLDQVE